jgi:hypothetical protein
MNRLKITFLPKARLGQWSLGLMCTFVVLVLFGTLLPGIERNPDLPDLIHNHVYAVLMYSGFASAIAAAFTGLISICRYKERSVLVYLSIPFGLLFFCGSLVMIAGLIAEYIRAI